jgi:hypothetical protein
MASQIRILHGSNVGTVFELQHQFIRIGSDSGNEICLTGVGIPAVAMVLELMPAKKAYRLYDRSHGRLLLNGKPLSGNGETIWEHQEKISIDDIVTLVIEDKTATADIPLPPLQPTPQTLSRQSKPPLPTLANETKRTTTPKQKTITPEQKPRQASPPIRLTSHHATKNKTMETVQMIGVIVIAGLVCYGIIYLNNPHVTKSEQHAVRPYSALAAELYGAVQEKTMPQKYMDILTYGREGEKKSPKKTLKAYIEMKQEILLKKEKINAVPNQLDNDLLEYINQRIGYLQKQPGK